jgi:hypothetical protein
MSSSFTNKNMKSLKNSSVGDLVSYVISIECDRDRNISSILVIVFGFGYCICPEA